MKKEGAKNGTLGDSVFIILECGQTDFISKYRSTEESKDNSIHRKPIHNIQICLEEYHWLSRSNTWLRSENIPFTCVLLSTAGSNSKVMWDFINGTQLQDFSETNIVSLKTY